MSVAVEPPVTTFAPSEPPRDSRVAWWRAELLCALGAATASLVLAVLCLRLWHLKVHVPLNSGGDALYQLVLIKTIMHQGWLGTNLHLGAPFGSALYDHTVAFGDTTQLLVAKVLGAASSDPVAVLNAMFLLGFPVIAVVTYAVLRDLGFGRLAAVTCSVIYALLPYHLFRNESHLALGMYWSVPVAGWLALGLLGHVRLFARRAVDGRGPAAWGSGRTLVTVLACVVVGSSGVYYAVFLLATVVVTATVRLLAERDVRPLAASAVVCALVVATVLAVQAPELVYHASHGANKLVGMRSPVESEVYGLKFAGLVVPAADHHIGPVARLGAKYWGRTLLPGEGPNTWLGSAMTLGLLVALVAALGAMFGRQARSRRARLLRDTGALAMICIAIGSIGGFGTLFAYLVSPQIRGWDRISVLIGFFAVVGLAAALSALGSRLRGRGRPGAVVSGALALGLMGFAAYDQMTPTAAPAYDASLATWRNDARFVAAVDAAMPPDAAILQLPYVPFPENPPVVAMADYDELKGYLHSDDLRFSYGATKGRQPDDWLAARSQQPVSRLLADAVAVGFRGVWLDTFGYVDRGSGVAQQIQRMTGASPSVVSDDHRHLFYDLSAVRARIDRGAAPQRAAAAEAALHPIQPSWGAGFYPLAEAGGPSTWHWSHSSGVLGLADPGRRPRTVDVRFALATPGTAAQAVAITLPGGARRTITTRPGREVRVRLRTTLAPGANAMGFATRAPDEASDPRDLRLRVIDLAVSDVSSEQVAAAARP